ncbi:erg26, C-3 sterol dehydrogenase, variant 2 [Balamuthia mandrillaris]
MVLQLVEWLGSGTSLLAVAIAVVVLLLLRATKKKKPTGFPRPRLFKRTPNLKVLTKKTGKQYLVIGGSGFLGSHLVEALLARGETRVRIFDLQNNPIFKDDPSVEFIPGNILNSQQLSKACQGVNVVFMPAALVDYWSRFAFQYEGIHAVNVVGMENVIAACQENGVEKLIQTSSSAVLLDAKSLQHAGVDETTPYTKNPPGHYSRTKVLAEKAVLAANGKRGLSTISIRPNGLFGPRDGVCFFHLFFFVFWFLLSSLSTFYRSSSRSSFYLLSSDIPFRSTMKIMTEPIYINGEFGPLLSYTAKQVLIHSYSCLAWSSFPSSLLLFRFLTCVACSSMQGLDLH